MNLSPAFFIISAARESLGKDEIIGRTDTLLRQLQGSGYATALCKGRVGCDKEPSILVIDEEPGSDDCLVDVLRLARVYRQDSILAVDCNKHARLVFTEPGQRPEALGLFVNMSQAQADAAGDYTERDGRYYTCVPLSDV